MSAEYVLRTYDLTKAFGRHRAVDHVSMNVRKGDIFGFIGKNGAGKTTFMKMVAGLANPTQGTIELFGKKMCSLGEKVLACSRSQNWSCREGESAV